MHVPRNIQSPYVAADFWAKWDSVNPRMVLCVKVTSRADFGSAVRGFTSNTRNMTLPGHPGVTFKASPGLTPSVIEQSLDEPTNLDLSGIYNSDSFTHMQVMGGMWNFAAIEIFSVCWDNVNLGEFVHMSGNLGEFKDHQRSFQAEARGKISRLSQEVDFVTTRICRAPEFRDPVFCKHAAITVVISSVTYQITHTNVRVIGAYYPWDTLITLNAGTLSGNAPPDDYFANGKMICTSGDNVGVTREIASYNATTDEIQLKRPFPFYLTGETGERFTLIAGCSHTLEDCIKFGNVVNRRAEDFVPGIESVNRLPPAT